MAYKKDAGPPPLQDPNSPDYECSVCHNRVNSLCGPCLDMAKIRAGTSPCHACQEMGQQRANIIKNACDNSHSYAPQPMSDTARSDSQYDVDVISDSSRSTDTTLDIDWIENLDRTVTVLKEVTMMRFQLASLFRDGKFEKDCETETDYSDMPPLEETKKTKYDSDEDSDDLPPLVGN